MIGLKGISKWTSWLSKGLNWRDTLAGWNSLAKKTRLHDTITTGLISGLVGTVVMDLSNLIFRRARLTERTYAEFGASVIMHPFRVRQRKNAVLGQILHMISGSIIGIPMAYMLKKSGRDYHLLKGAALGSVLWGGLYAVGRRIGLITAKPWMTQSHYSELWHNLLYGITASQAIVSLADPAIFTQEREARITEPSEGEYPQTIVPGGEQRRRKWHSFGRKTDYAEPVAHGNEDLSGRDSGDRTDGPLYN